MRRKRFQRGCLKTRKRNGKNYWYAQWREEGKPKSKEIGLCSKMDRVKAEGILTEILKPINEGAENPEKITWTFAKFCEVVYLPVCHRKWKASTGMVETNRLEVHLVRPLGAEVDAGNHEEVNCRRFWTNRLGVAAGVWWIISGSGYGRSSRSR